MRVILWAVSPHNIFESLMNEVGAGRVALCAVVATRGLTAQPAATIVYVDSTALMTGSLGGGMEVDVRRSALQDIDTPNDLERL